VAKLQRFTDKLQRQLRRGDGEGRRATAGERGCAALSGVSVGKRAATAFRVSKEDAH
jgi:hypothetical protein